MGRFSQKLEQRNGGVRMEQRNGGQTRTAERGRSDWSKGTRRVRFEQRTEEGQTGAAR